MSCLRSPSTTSRSACRPSANRPFVAPTPHAAAAPDVAVASASAGPKPAVTSSQTAKGSVPCRLGGAMPESTPDAGALPGRPVPQLPPALRRLGGGTHPFEHRLERGRPASRAGPRRSSDTPRSDCAPGPPVFSALTWPKPRSVTHVQCSMPSTPTAIACSTDGVPCAWAVTGRPAACERSTTSCSSSVSPCASHPYPEC